jgi:F-type H+-transporting ATPase subunit b
MRLKEILFFILTFLLISTYRATAAEDILSVDKTLIIQIIIFIASIFILNAFLFKPILELLEKREKLTTGTIKEAKKLEEEVEHIIKDYEAKLNEARSQAIEERGEIRRRAQAAAEDLIGKARKEAQILLEEAKIKLELEAKEIKEKIRPDIEVLARELASQILRKEV